MALFIPRHTGFDPSSRFYSLIMPGFRSDFLWKSLLLGEAERPE
jgi:hypothetical protein